MPSSRPARTSQRRRSARADEAVSEVLGSVMLVALSVTMLGAFGGLVLSTVMSDTPTPPAATFSLEPQRNASTVDARLVSGSSLALAETMLILQVDGSDRLDGSHVTDGAAVGRWAPGETLRLNLSAPLASDERIFFMAVDVTTGKTIGIAYAAVPGDASGTAILQNVLSATLSFDASPLTADGLSSGNATVQVTSSMGLVLVDRVVLDLTAVGGASAVTLHNDANDGVYTAEFVVEGYTFDSLPGHVNISIPATVYDIVGKTAATSATLYLTSAPHSKAGAGVVYRDIGSSAVITDEGYVNLSAFTFRDEPALDSDQIELRVSDLADSTKVWSAIVNLDRSGCTGPAVTSIVLRRDGLAGNVTYTPAGGCFLIDADARLNLANVSTSLDAGGATPSWTAVGTASDYIYASAGIGASNEALISFFGDALSASRFDAGISQADFSWAPPASNVATAPGSISTLSAARGDTFVDLSWSAPGDGGSPITGYKIYRGGVIIDTIGVNTTYRAAGLTNGVEYTFRVSAVNAIEEGELSNTVTATPAAVPSAPQTFSATEGDASASLSWGAPSSNGGSAIITYNVYVGTSSGATTWLASTGGTNTSFVVNGLTNGIAYFFNVTAESAVGQGTSSAEASATPSTLPAPPGSLTATAGNARVTLTWTAGDDGGSALTDHTIYRGVLSGVRTLLATTGSGANTSFVDMTALNGVTYHYTVRAANANGQGADSSERSATPSLGAGVPSPPQSLEATRGNASVALSWSAPATDGGSAVTSYHVYVGTASGATSWIGSTGGDNTSFTVNGLTNGQPYFFNVTAVNTVGQSAGSNEANATPASVPNPPTSFTATVGTGQVALSWASGGTGGSAITNYQVWRGTSSGSLSLLTTIGTNTTYTDLAVTGGTTYFYHMRAVNAVGTSNPSVERSATPVSAGSAPSAPLGLLLTPADQRVHLSWSAPSSDGGSAVTGYGIYRSLTNGSGSMTLVQTIGTNTSYANMGLTNGTTYYFQVVAINAIGSGTPTAIKDATPNGAIPLDCSSQVTGSGVYVAGSCSSLQTKDDIFAELQETQTGAQGNTKELSMEFRLNVTGVTGTQQLQLVGRTGNAAENLLIEALNVGTGNYVPLMTLSSATTVTLSVNADAATYWPAGALTIRLRDAGPDGGFSSWHVDYFGLVTT